MRWAGAPSNGPVSAMDYLYGILLALLAGLFTLIGCFMAMYIKGKGNLCMCLGMGFTAGVMIFVAFVELLGISIGKIGLGYALVSFFVGMLLIYVIDISVPHHYKAEKDRRLLRVGFMVMLGLAIHNFPEGMAVLFSATADTKLGLAVAIAIAIHNIPEGIAVSLPILQATKSRTKAFTASLFTAIAEPLGAFIGMVLLASFISEQLIYILLAGVGGTMVFISFDELLPEAFNYQNRHTIIAGVIAGMGVMALSLVVIG